MRIDDLLREMLNKKGSEMFIAVGAPVSIKVNGSLEAIHDAEVTPEDAEGLIRGMMREPQKSEFESQNECSFALSKSGLGRFRVSAYMQRNCHAAVVRHVKVDIPTCSDLSIPGVVQDSVLKKRGLVILAGEFDVRKAATMAALVEHRSSQSAGHIITIEDPVAYIHNHNKSIVSQREVGIDTGSYKSALRSAMGQIPDMVAIGELFTQDTLEHILKISQSGSVVVTTMLGGSAVNVIDAIVKMYAEKQAKQIKHLLANNLSCILTQKIVNSSSTNGTCLTSEVLVVDDEIREMIRADDHLRELNQIMERKADIGCMTFDMGLAALVKEGKMSDLDAAMVAEDESMLKNYIASDI